MLTCQSHCRDAAAKSQNILHVKSETQLINAQGSHANPPEQQQPASLKGTIEHVRSPGRQRCLSHVFAHSLHELRGSSICANAGSTGIQLGCSTHQACILTDSPLVQDSCGQSMRAGSNGLLTKPFTCTTNGSALSKELNLSGDISVQLTESCKLRACGYWRRPIGCFISADQLWDPYVSTTLNRLSQVIVPT